VCRGARDIVKERKKGVKFLEKIPRQLKALLSMFLNFRSIKQSNARETGKKHKPGVLGT